MKIKPKNPAAVAMGKIKSESKSRASRENGKKGGRPRTKTGPVINVYHHSASPAPDDIVPISEESMKALKGIAAAFGIEE